MTAHTNKPPIWFWIVSVIAILWNAMGVDQYIGQAYKTERWRSAITDEQFETISNMPSWLTAAFAIAVFSGVLGSLGLLLRKKWATSLLILSLLAVIVQMGYILTQGHTNNMGMTISIIVFALFLVWFSKKSETKGWIS
ncbi:MAG: hypothetical protein GW839_12935 [Flavobacteriales bacterium]|nr:hypothetical protein [Flavobacteriia bacterium]NCP61189.1 hypothetical protein [Flavobacteriales bacterium]PIV94986.1 MAG: hypothetical protein COW44_01305 [Flavobacteriaceae bacterium CG17_big_fil_post_rev_8_21_14_2_50_33_15]PIY12016.1 MAG: hypothetical protein COZ17_04835 [Flavobacteriaceae bacterium CG_4_10_14_3_um_filter_33_47]PJB18888.1 MAG: hypothetical protein CO117_06685 [Flavobacteriaceae bacterium CG_4_9_14_3_um_filter_33_16]